MKIGEAATGLSEEMADVGLSMQRAQDKTEAMRARASAIDELVEQGTLQDVGTTGQDPIASELSKVKAKANVDSDLARLKAQVSGSGS